MCKKQHGSFRRFLHRQAEGSLPYERCGEWHGSRYQNGNAFSRGIAKGAGVKPAPKVLDLYRNPKGVKKSSVHNSSPL